MIKRLLFISLLSLLFLLSCAKEDSLAPITSGSQNLDPFKYGPIGLVTTPITSTPRLIHYKLTVGTNQGGWVNFEESSLRGRDSFYIFRPAGSDVTVSATPAEGFEFSGWSNGWTVNPITFKLNSNISFSANFTNTND